MTDTIFQFVDNIKSFTHFDEKEISLLLECIKTKKVQKGDCLLQAPKISKEFFYVHKGCLRTFYTDNKGSEYTRCIALAGSFCWTIPSFLKGVPGNESIEAVVDSELLVVTREKFQLLQQKSGGFRYVYQTALEALCITYASRVESFITMNATERYKNLLLKNPSIIQQLSNKVVSSYLGITQESLSRIKARK